MKIFKKYLNAKWILLFSIALFVVNFISKFIYISYTEIGLDEPFSIFHAQKDITSIFKILKDENNPPLYFVFLHYWIKYFGISAISVRLPSVIFASLSSVVILRIGCKFFSNRVGFFTSIFYSASTLHVYYAHDARVYTIFIFLTCINIYYFLSIINDAKELKIDNKFLIFTITNVLLCYSHFFGFILIGTELIVCFLFINYRRHFYQCLLSITIVLFSFIWYIPTIIHRFEESARGTWVQKPIFSDLYTMLWRFSNAPVATVFMISLILLPLIIKHRKKIEYPNSSYKALFYCFIFSYLGLFLISFFIPLFIDRYLLFTSIFYYLLVAISIDLICFNSSYSIFLYLSVAIIMLATLDLKKGKISDITGLIRSQNNKLKLQKSIIISPAWNNLNFTYHYDKNIFSNPSNYEEILSKESIFPVNDSDEIKYINLLTPFAYIDFNFNSSPIRKYLFDSYLLTSVYKYNGGITLFYFDDGKVYLQKK